METVMSSLSTADGAAWLSGVVGLLVKGTVLLVVVAVVATALRRTSAGLRHLVWSVGLAGVLVLPAAMALPWRLELLPARVSWGMAGAAAPGVERVDGPALAGADAAEPATPAPSAPGLDERGGVVAAVEGLTLPAEAAAGPRVDGAGAGWGGAPAGWGGVLLALLAAWVVVAAGLLTHVAAGAVLVRGISRRAKPLDAPDWTTPLYEAADRLELADVPRLLASGEVSLPFTYGVFRPTIVLPESAEAWSEERRRAVLFHELGHVRRLDLLSHLVGRIACAVYWFHPLVWMAARRARAECERACDDLVLSAGTRASSYADHLLQIVCGAARTSAPAVAIPMAQRKEFEGRMLAILEPGVRRDAPSRRQATVVAAGLAALSLSLAAVAPARGDAALPDARVDSNLGETAAGPTADGSAGAAFDVDDGPGLGGGSPDGAGDGALRREPLDAHAAAVSDGDSPDAHGAAAAGGGSVHAPRGGAPDHRGGAEPGAPALAPLVADTDHVKASTSRRRGLPTPVPTPTPTPTPTPAPLARGWDRARIESVAPRFRYRASSRGTKGDSATVAALVQALGDADAGVRLAAVHALGEIGDERAVAALSRAVRDDPDAEVRRMAAWALGEIGSPAAVPALADAVSGDEHREVRRMAAWALGEIGDAAAVEALGAAIRSGHEEVASMAVWALGEIGDPRAAPALAAALESTSPDTRRQAAWALGEIGGEAAVAPLAAALGDERAEVRRMAAWGLGEVEPGRAPAALIGALGDGDAGVRKMVAWALGQITDPATAPPLSAALEDPNADVRRTAMWALGEIGGEPAREALLRAIRSDDPEIRRLAAQALARTY